MSRCKSSALACRIPVARPARKSRGTATISVETRWGRAIVTGGLDQRHLDLLDAIFLHNRGHRLTSEGDLLVRVDTGDLLTRLGRSRWNIRLLNWCIDDLSETRIDLWDMHEQQLTSTHVFLRYNMPTDEVGRPARLGSRQSPPPPPTSKAQEDWGTRNGRTVREKLKAGTIEIMVSREWLRIRKEFPTWYPSQVWHLQYGVSQAVARFMLSHDPGADYLLQTALTYLGVPTKHQARATEQVQADAEAMAEIGVTLAGGHVYRAELTRTVSGPHRNPTRLTPTVSGPTRTVSD